MWYAARVSASCDRPANAPCTDHITDTFMDAMTTKLSELSARSGEVICTLDPHAWYKTVLTIGAVNSGTGGSSMQSGADPGPSTSTGTTHAAGRTALRAGQRDKAGENE